MYYFLPALLQTAHTVLLRVERNLNFKYLLDPKLKSSISPPTGSQSVPVLAQAACKPLSTGQGSRSRAHQKSQIANAGGVSLAVPGALQEQASHPLSVPQWPSGARPAGPAGPALPQPRTATRSGPGPATPPSFPLPSLPSSCSLYLCLRFRHGAAGESCDIPGNERETRR